MLLIHYDDEELLHEKLKEVETPISQESIKEVLQMNQYLKLSQDEQYAKKHKLRSGIGLAASQIGLNKRMIAVYLQTDNQLYSYALINPKVISRSQQMCYLSSGEGCLSVKNDVNGLVRRNFRIKVSAYDAITNKDIQINASGYLAICLQHELDHLDGILYYDRINKQNPFYKEENDIEI